MGLLSLRKGTSRLKAMSELGHLKKRATPRGNVHAKGSVRPHRLGHEQERTGAPSQASASKQPGLDERGPQANRAKTPFTRPGMRRSVHDEFIRLKKAV